MATKKRSKGNFATYFTTRNGRRVYAHQYGLKAFPIGFKNKKKRKD